MNMSSNCDDYELKLRWVTMRVMPLDTLLWSPVHFLWQTSYFWKLSSRPVLQAACYVGHVRSFKGAGGALPAGMHLKEPTNAAAVSMAVYLDGLFGVEVEAIRVRNSIMNLLESPSNYARLRRELAVYLNLKGDLLDTACAWCRDEGIEELRHIWGAVMVSEFVDVLSLSPEDKQVLPEDILFRKYLRI